MKKGMSGVTKQYLLESEWSLVLSQSIDVVVLGQSGSNWEELVRKTDWKVQDKKI